MLSSGDEFPIHQVAEPVRFAATSDRNFYDRYYFNLHGCNGGLFLATGMGLYPNLATQDAFAVVRRGDAHRVVRASRELGDRMDTSVGPFRIEVLEPLRRLRVVLEDTGAGLSFDLSWEGSIPAFQEPRQFIRTHGRVLFDSMRFVQTGHWTGTLRVGDEETVVTPERWWGTRDRSWGVRPVGEAEPPGIRGDEGQMTGMWNYAPMQFDDHSIVYMLNELADGTRVHEHAVRIWRDPDRAPEPLGRPEHRHVLRPGTREVARSTLSFPQAPGGGFDVEVTPLTSCYVMVGTGYGIDADWRHGMYQGPMVVQGLHLDMVDDADRMFGIVDAVARFELSSTGQVGFGLHEYFFIGDFPRYGLTGWDGAPP